MSYLQVSICHPATRMVTTGPTSVTAAAASAGVWIAMATRWQGHAPTVLQTAVSKYTLGHRCQASVIVAGNEETKSDLQGSKCTHISTDHSCQNRALLLLLHLPQTISLFLNVCLLFAGVILESSGDLGSGDSLFTDDDEDSFVLNDQAGMDDEDDEDEDDVDDNDEYLS